MQLQVTVERMEVSFKFLLKIELLISTSGVLFRYMYRCMHAILYMKSINFYWTPPFLTPFNLLTSRIFPTSFRAISAMMWVLSVIINFLQLPVKFLFQETHRKEVRIFSRNIIQSSYNFLIKHFGKMKKSEKGVQNSHFSRKMRENISGCVPVRRRSVRRERV